MNTSLGLFCIQFLPIDPFHLTHRTLKQCRVTVLWSDCWWAWSLNRSRFSHFLTRPIETQWARQGMHNAGKVCVCEYPDIYDTSWHVCGDVWRKAASWKHILSQAAMSGVFRQSGSLLSVPVANIAQTKGGGGLWSEPSGQGSADHFLSESSYSGTEYTRRPFEDSLTI